MRPGPAAACLLLAAAARGEPGRSIRYAESGNRLAYAFIFGHQDTCRVYLRAQPPMLDREAYQRRPFGVEYKGEPGDRLVREFRFGPGGRPLHLVPANDGRSLLAFSNRVPGGGAPARDTLYRFEGEKDRSEPLDYSGLPAFERPRWPRLDRALAEAKPEEVAVPPLDYAFCSLEPAAGRILVARQSEGEDGRVEEMVCFVVTLREPRVRLPEESELLGLLRHDEPLFRAGAAWALSHAGNREHVPALKASLERTLAGPARAALAEAIIRCGDDAARKTLRALLQAEGEPAGRRAAAVALATLPPDRADGEALSVAIGDADASTALAVGVALARLGDHGAAMAVRASRSTRREIRVAAARVLGRMEAPQAEERLLRMVGDPEAEVQLEAARALTRPPRAILPENHDELARALDACRLRKNRNAASRLAKLAAHAGIRDERVLKALVDLAPFHEQAIESLALLTGERLTTPEECRAWWAGR